MSEALFHTTELAFSNSPKLVDIWTYRTTVGTEEERRLAKRVLALVSAKAFDLKTFHRLKDDFLGLYSEDPKTRAEIVSLLAEFVDKYPSDDGFPDKAVKVAQDTAVRYPKNPESHLLLATMLSTYRHEPPAENIRHYVACLKLESTHEGCRRGYGRLVDQLTEPRCSGDDLRGGLNLSIADDRLDPKGVYVNKKMYEGTLELYLPKRPTLGGIPLAKTVAIAKDGTVFLFPSDEAKPYVESILRQAEHGSRNLVVHDDETILAAVRMTLNMSTNPIVFVPPDGLPNAPSYDVLTNRFCKKTTKPELAAELRL